MNTIHICFSETAYANVSHGLKKGYIKGEKVLSLQDDLSLGYINSNNLIDNRQLWWDRVYGQSNNRYLIPTMERVYREFWNNISHIKDQAICLWFGRNAQEACGMLYLLNLIKEKNLIVEYVNVSIDPIDAKKVTNVGDVPSIQLSSYYEKKKVFKEDVLERLYDEWNVLVEDNTLLRIVNKNTIKSVSEDYYDKTILSKIDTSSKEASRVAALVMASVHAPMCDRFVLWRIRELILMNKIKSEGNPYNMMELHVKKNI